MYIGPFEGGTIEAMLSGTPVITTDFGVVTETVKHGVTDYRCNILKEFVYAAGNISALLPEDCRRRTVENFSIEKVKPHYDEFFKKMNSLFTEGWYKV